MSGAERTAVLGIRHHGPGSARSVVAELDRLQPAAVLIEGPSDADPLLALGADPGMTPPVALLAYVTGAPRISAFWPYAVFSPEWQALRWAAAHDVPVRFCDLPSSQVLAGADGEGDEGGAEDDEEGVSGPASEPAITAGSEPVPLTCDPIGQLAAAAGYDDPERWWDDVIESRLGGLPPFAALTEAMAELRASVPAGSVGAEARHELRREAYMRQVLRATLKQTDGIVAVVCGAWHAPALDGRLPAASADAALLRGAAKRKTSLAWVPWTHSRLAAASGYGAGVTSPGWYHHLFTAPDHVIVRWLTRVAGVLRAHDLPVSSAHVIEGVRLAEALAALRGRPLAGLAEVSEATRAVLCDGDELAAGFVTRDLVVGELLGAVPEHAPMMPLEADLRAEARRLRLKIDPGDKDIALDLRKPYDRDRSVLLHRLGILGVRWGTPADDLVQSSGTFRETWSLRWRPELAVAIVDAATWGTTVEVAASARITDAAAQARDLATVTAAVEGVLLAGLPDALPAVLAALDARAALDADVEHLMAALPALVRAVRYGDVRGTDTAALDAVVDALVVRICAGLPAAVSSLADDAAARLRSRLDATHAAITLHARAESARPVRERWMGTLARLADRRDVHGLVAGRIVRILADSRAMDPAEAALRFAASLSAGAPPASQAAWAEGFLSGSGLLLVHDRDLLAVLDGWLATLKAPDFLDALPLLRRTFGEFSEAERANIGDAARQLGAAGPDRAAVASPVDERLAAPVLATVAAILGGPR